MTGVHKALRQSVHDHLAEGQWQEAEELCRESLLILRELDPVHTDVVIALCRLGWILDRRGNAVEAAACATRARGILDELAATLPAAQRDPLLFDTLLLHGAALRRLGRYAESETLLQRAVRLAEMNPDTPDLVVTACHHLALTCQQAGNSDQAACLYGLAILFSTHAFGDVNAVTATMCYQLGALQHQRGRANDGLTPARRAWEMRTTLLGTAHPDTAAAEALLFQLQASVEAEAQARPRPVAARTTLAKTITLAGLCPVGA